MDTWKAMLAATAVLVLFGVVVSVADLSIDGPSALAVLAVIAVFSVVFYVVSKRGYRFGRRLGESMRDDE